MNFYSKGSWPAVMTAFQKNGALDFSAQEALLNHYIETGGAGLFINS